MADFDLSALLIALDLVEAGGMSDQADRLRRLVREEERRLRDRREVVGRLDRDMQGLLGDWAHLPTTSRVPILRFAGAFADWLGDPGPLLRGLEFDIRSTASDPWAGIDFTFTVAIAGRSYRVLTSFRDGGSARDFSLAHRELVARLGPGVELA